MSEKYIHGSSQTERRRLALMNELINPDCLRALGLTKETLLLDVGCGTGIFTRLMAAQLPTTARLVAIERDTEQLAAARSAGAIKGATIDFRQGDALNLPLRDGERGGFDLAHCRFLLEHVSESESVVRQMVQAVRPGGRVVLLDDDHSLIRFWPEPPGLAAAWRAYYRSYALAGTDPLIGRKLVDLLHKAGARPRRITQLFYGACAGEQRFGGIMENLIGVLEGARHTVLRAGEIDSEQYDRSLAECHRFAQRPDAAVWYVINWAEGVRPRS